MSTGATCQDCGAQPGEPHADGCDVARCHQTGLQRLSCLEDHDHGRDIWTGTWPGAAECGEFGWYAAFSPDAGWLRCGPDEPGAMPDLNRLYSLSGEAVWDREQLRWVRLGTELVFLDSQVGPAFPPQPERNRDYQVPPNAMDGEQP